MNPRLLEISRAEAAARGRDGAVCLLPVGSLEQHGEHLPVGTDSLLVETVCLRAAGLAHRDVVVAPTVWTGLSPHHVRLGLTVTLEPELLLELSRSILGSLRRWFPRVVIVNGHGGNRGWLGALALAEECPLVHYWELVDQSVLRDLFPSRSRIDRSRRTGRDVRDAGRRAGLVGPLSAGFEPILRENDPFLLPDMGASGVLGDPSAASAAAGEQFVGAACQGLAELLDTLDTNQTEETRP